MNENIYRTMKQKRLIIFIPSIEGGGVEKNLFIISDYLKDKIKNISLITVSNKFKNRFSHKIRFVSPKGKFLGLDRKKKKIYCWLISSFFSNFKG